ncbi:uncharacterized protein LOC142220348 [Haematobia irritans]|uniref:uncharacterized protein LOC142220348 n=1 Tax=Haematobia irritans TaxID=7368 RepID=UPI003F50A45E
MATEQDLALNCSKWNAQFDEFNGKLETIIEQLKANDLSFKEILDECVEELKGNLEDFITQQHGENKLYLKQTLDAAMAEIRAEFSIRLKPKVIYISNNRRSKRNTTNSNNSPNDGRNESRSENSNGRRSTNSHSVVNNQHQSSKNKTKNLGNSPPSNNGRNENPNDQRRTTSKGDGHFGNSFKSSNKSNTSGIEIPEISKKLENITKPSSAIDKNKHINDDHNSSIVEGGDDWAIASEEMIENNKNACCSLPTLTEMSNISLEKSEAKFLLENLNLQNFEETLEKLIKQFDTSVDEVTKMALLIFETIVNKPINATKLYGQFIKCIYEKIPTFMRVFIERLLIEFQTSVANPEFMRDHLQMLMDEINASTDPEEISLLKMKMENEEIKMRRRNLVTVHLIAEMCKQKMLTYDRVMLCIELFLEHGNNEKFEYMCELLNAIGYHLEQASLNNSMNSRMDKVFDKMKCILTNENGTMEEKIDTRVRYMIEDLIDLRNRQWDQALEVPNIPDRIEESNKDQGLENQALEVPNIPDRIEESNNDQGLENNNSSRRRPSGKKYRNRK